MTRLAFGGIEMPKRPHHPEDDLPDRGIADWLYHGWGVNEIRAALTALQTGPGVPADLVEEFVTALRVAEAPPREPAPAPEWAKDARTVPVRMFADEACTVEVFPNPDGTYSAPENGLQLWGMPVD
jgi:hypothetical protein